MGAGIIQAACCGVGMLLNGGRRQRRRIRSSLSHGGGYWCALTSSVTPAATANTSLPAIISTMAASGSETLFPAPSAAVGVVMDAEVIGFDDKGHMNFPVQHHGQRHWRWHTACSVRRVSSAATITSRPPTAWCSRLRGRKAASASLISTATVLSSKATAIGHASSNWTYHNPDECGANSQLPGQLRHRATESPAGLRKHTIIQRGAAGGLLIRRTCYDEVTNRLLATIPAAKTRTVGLRERRQANGQQARLLLEGDLPRTRRVPDVIESSCSLTVVLGGWAWRLRGALNPDLCCRPAGPGRED